eukprot:scaffold79984_cov31-Tisochrysis_lutea.AAC.1
MASNDASVENTFRFHLLPGGIKSLGEKSAKELLAKWNLDVHMQAHSFRYDQHFTPQQLDAFLCDFFNDPTVQATAPVCTGRQIHSWGSMGSVSSVKADRLSTSVVRLDFFDRLEKEVDIVRAGYIAKCLDVPCEEMVIASDKLRLMLLDESSEEWGAYSRDERRELIFHILSRLAIGGGLNQYEDHIEPYLTMTKSLYKDLVAVQKDGAGQLHVRSIALQVLNAAGAVHPLFPTPSRHNFCYLTIDPLQRHVRYWYGAFFPMM